MEMLSHKWWDPDPGPQGWGPTMRFLRKFGGQQLVLLHTTAIQKTPKQGLRNNTNQQRIINNPPSHKQIVEDQEMDPLPMTWRYLGGCPFGALAKKLSLVVTQEQNDLNPALQWHLHNAALVQRVLLGGWTVESNWLTNCWNYALFKLAHHPG